jgi:drug/metabolite transporter (DMT)-like permease
MSRSGRLGTLARYLAPLWIPFVPKCPFCLLPLFAAAGIALPTRPLLDGAVALTAAAWAAIVISTARWAPVRLAAVVAAVGLVAGRALESTWLTAAGAALVLAIVFWTRRRPRACSARVSVTNPGFPSTNRA